MKTIPLTQGYKAIVDDEDYEDLMKWKWHVMVQNGNPIKASRRIRRGSGVQVAIGMHTHIMGERHGFLIDHINHNPIDNRRQNLRFATCAQNIMNGRPWAASKYKGVYKTHKLKNKWWATLSSEGKRYYLGVFPTKKMAAMAYDKKAKEIFGEFAFLNFPSCS